MFGKILPLLLAVIAFSLFAHAADADVVLGYDVNSSPEKAAVSFDGLDLMMAQSNTTLDLSAEVEETGASQMFSGASIVLNATLTDSETVSVGGSAVGTLLLFSGDVTFSDAAADPIISFTFDDSSLYLPNNATSGSLIWSSSSASGTVTEGSAMASLLNGQELLLPADFAFTLTKLNGDVDGFTAQSSFSATATVIPEPASFAMLGLCSAVLLRRRRPPHAR